MATLASCREHCSLSRVLAAYCYRTVIPIRRSCTGRILELRHPLQKQRNTKGQSTPNQFIDPSLPPLTSLICKQQASRCRVQFHTGSGPEAKALLLPRRKRLKFFMVFAHLLPVIEWRSSTHTQSQSKHRTKRSRQGNDIAREAAQEIEDSPDQQPLCGERSLVPAIRQTRCRVAYSRGSSQAG